MSLCRRPILLGICCATVLFSSCRKTESTRKTLNIGTFSRAIDYSPFYVAQHFAWFDQHPAFKRFQVKYREFNDRGEISSAFDSGQLDAIYCAEPPAIICRAQENDIRIAGISCTLEQEIVVRRQLAINTAADLKGRSIAVLDGTSSQYGLFKTLSAVRLSPADVNIVNMGPDQAQAAFQSGRIDAWAVWPPFIQEEQVSGRGRVLTGGDAVIQSVMAVPETLIKRESDIARALVEIENKSKDWIMHHPEEAQSIVAKRLDLQLEVVKAAWAKHHWDSHLSDPAVVADITDKVKFLSQGGKIRRELDVKKDLIYPLYDQR